MAAGTEGFTDTTGGKGHLGSIISKAIAARRFAEDERKLAEEKAKKAGYDSLEEIGVEKGYFFKAALKSKFGGSYLSGKKQDIKAAVDRVKLLKNPKANFWNFVDNRDAEGKEVKKLSEVERFRKQFDNYNFVSAKRPPEKEDVKAETPVVPKKMSPFDVAQSQKAVTQERMLAKTEEKTAKAASGGGGGRVSREDILTAVSAIASSLEKTAQSINNTIGETKVIAEGVQAIKTDVVTQLSERTDSIEAKLDAIVAAINAQTDLQKKMTDDAETAKSMAAAKQQGDAADSGDFDDLSTAEDESADDVSDKELNLGEFDSPAATSAQDIEFQQQDMYRTPEAETGGIISGPDEGYLAKLHGDEMVIPLDNNYTQGQPSAMDGKVRPVPETPALPKFETGTPAPSPAPAPSSLGGKVGFTSLDLGMGSKSDSAADAMAQPLMDAMSLPMMVAGGTILSSVNQLMNSLGVENADVANEIAKIARPIADVFGLPNNLVNKASGGMKSEESDGKDKDGRVKEKKKGFLGNLFEGLKNALSGSRGRPGGGGGGGDPGVSPNFTGEGGDRAMNYLMSQGLTKEQAAGVAGNLQQESTFNPRADNTGTGENDTQGHFGIAQWDKVHRWPKVKKWMQDNNLDPYSLDGQLQAMVWEAKERGDWSKLKEVTDASSAARSWLENFERSGEQPGDHGYDARIANARMWAEKELVAANPESRPATGPSTPNAPGATPNQPKSSQEIVENFGLNTGQRLYFEHGGRYYHGYKTTRGWDIYKGVIPIDTSNGQNQPVVQALIKAGEERTKAQQIQPPSSANGQTTASAATAQQESLRPAERRRRTQGSTAGVAVLNSGGQQRSSSTAARPDSSTAVVRPGSDNNLTDAYNSTPVTSS